VAGTTRDALRQTLQIDGVPVHVVDTAGLRADAAQADDPVERIGIERAWQHIAGADAVLFLHDLTRVDDAAYRAGDQAIARQLATQLPAGAPLLHVWNKRDAAADAAREAALASTGPNAADANVLAISARTGVGLDTLRARLLRLAGWQGGSGEGLFLARQRHVQALTRAGAYLGAAAAHLQARAPMLDLIAEELRLAQNALGEITGEFGADDLLGAIFSRFCIGK
jgi:tRNA modification GTPase